jgi:hypothetical protein
MAAVDRDRLGPWSPHAEKADIMVRSRLHDGVIVAFVDPPQHDGMVRWNVCGVNTSVARSRERGMELADEVLALYLYKWGES